MYAFIFDCQNKNAEKKENVFNLSPLKTIFEIPRRVIERNFSDMKAAVEKVRAIKNADKIFSDRVGKMAEFFFDEVFPGIVFRDVETNFISVEVDEVVQGVFGGAFERSKVVEMAAERGWSVDKTGQFFRTKEQNTPSQHEIQTLNQKQSEFITSMMQFVQKFD
jgi:hypothetical protein